MTIFCIEGNIGAGKSTLIDKVSNLLTKHNIEHKTYKEPIEEWQPALSAFYADKSKAFDLEMTTLGSHLRMLEDAKKQKIAIIERNVHSQEYDLCILSVEFWLIKYGILTDLISVQNIYNKLKYLYLNVIS